MKEILSAVRVGFRTGRVFLPCVLAFSLAAKHGHAAASVGGGVLKFNVFGEVTSDSNVMGDTTDQSDVMFTLRPQVEFDREGSLGTTHLDAGIGFQRFSDLSDQNSENWSVNGSIAISEDRAGRLTGGVNLSYFNGAETNVFLAQRADIKRLSVGVNSSYLVSGRTSVRLGLTHESYDTDIRPAGDSTGLRAGVAWQVREALNWFLDYTRTRTQTDSSPTSLTQVDFTSNQLTTGFDGQINAVWSGSISAGFSDLSAASDDSGGDSSGFVASVELNWKLRQNTTIGFAGGRNTRVTPNADAIDAVTASVNVSQKIGAALGASAGLVWETFETRGLGDEKDDRVAVNLALDYSISDRFGCGGSIRHDVRNSANPLLDTSRTAYTIFGRVTF